MRKILSGIGVAVVIVAAVAFVWMANKCYFGFYFNMEVKPIEVVTLALTIIIAILLQFYFVSDADNLRVEKNLLITNVNDALSKLRECRDTFMKCYEGKRITRADASVIKSQIRSLNHSLDALEISLSKSRCRKLKIDCETLKKEALNYKGILTGGTFPAKPYPSAIYTDHQKKYRMLDTSLQELIFLINKA